MTSSFLRNHSLTRGFSSAEIERLAGMLSEQKLPANEKLCSSGAAIRGLYLVHEGAIAISGRDAKGTTQRITTLEAPTLIGELEIISGQPAFADATAETPVLAYLLTHDAFDDLVNKGDSMIGKLTRNIARIVIQRLVESNSRLVSLMYK